MSLNDIPPYVPVLLLASTCYINKLILVFCYYFCNTCNLQLWYDMIRGIILYIYEYVYVPPWHLGVNQHVRICDVSYTGYQIIYEQQEREIQTWASPEPFTAVCTWTAGNSGYTVHKVRYEHIEGSDLRAQQLQAIEQQQQQQHNRAGSGSGNRGDRSFYPTTSSTRPDPISYRDTKYLKFCDHRLWDRGYW